MNTRSYTGNLAQLASFLEGLPDNYLHFDMESFFHDPRSKMETERDEMIQSMALTLPVQGMCGCALGHSAAAGFTLDGSAVSWLEVAQTLYGVEGEAYDYLFGGEWYLRDNTAKGAARRIRAYLRDGVPAGWRDEDEDFILTMIDYVAVQTAELCPA